MRSMFVVAFGMFVGVSFAPQNAKAETQSDDLIRLSKLSLSAFECSVVATDKKEDARLFEVGLTAGRKFLDGMNRLEPAKMQEIEREVALIWLNKDNPSNDFVLGEVYQFIRERVFHELDYYQNEGGELAILNGNKGRMFLQKNCALIQ
jgi:hypothetical protein